MTAKSATHKVSDQLPMTTYYKWQLMSSDHFNNCTEVLNALLEEGKPYTLAEARTIITTFMKREA